MSHGKWLAIVRLLREFAPAGSHGLGASDQEVERVGWQLGCILPVSYRRFLKEFGWTFWPTQIYGVSDAPGLSVINATIEEQTILEPHMPTYLVALANDGLGNHYCLDTSKLVDGESPVVFWDHELGEDQVPERVAANFLDWLQESLQERLEFERDYPPPALGT